MKGPKKSVVSVITKHVGSNPSSGTESCVTLQTSLG